MEAPFDGLLTELNGKNGRDKSRDKGSSLVTMDKNILVVWQSGKKTRLIPEKTTVRVSKIPNERTNKLAYGNMSKR